MPLYDFGSVDETNPVAGYNWGYDPVQYNVPEGSFSTQPNDPYQRILELQQVIDAYHEADLSLIMDVVYNHVYLSDDFAFERMSLAISTVMTKTGSEPTGPSVATM